MSSLFSMSDADVQRLLHEDAPFGDLTTHALGISAHKARILFAPRRTGVTACTEEAARMLELCGATVLHTVDSGTTVAAGEEIIVAEGSAGALHMAWKSAQTMLEYAMAVATGTQSIVEAAKAGNPLTTVVCTRKAIPGTRALAAKAVLAGGGMPHRLGLSDSVLVFAQHRVFLGDDPVPGLVELARRLPERHVTIEVHSVDEAAALLGPLRDAKTLPGVIQLDKGSPQDVADLRRLLDDLVRPTGAADNGSAKLVLAAAGGITGGNASAYAQAGADVLVTSSPYYEKPLDVAVRIVTAS